MLKNLELDENSPYEIRLTLEDPFIEANIENKYVFNTEIQETFNVNFLQEYHDTDHGKKGIIIGVLSDCTSSFHLYEDSGAVYEFSSNEFNPKFLINERARSSDNSKLAVKVEEKLNIVSELICSFPPNIRKNIDDIFFQRNKDGSLLYNEEDWQLYDKNLFAYFLYHPETFQKQLNKVLLSNFSEFDNVYITRIINYFANFLLKSDLPFDCLNTKAYKIYNELLEKYAEIIYMNADQNRNLIMIT